MDGLLHEAVRARAHHRCEYCHFPAEFAELPFHIDHIVARQHGGRSISEHDGSHRPQEINGRRRPIGTCAHPGRELR